ncbi:hypothetical protein L3Q82_017219 [Scortum barcoo]|uniref:Uncharacterized protein n=1 Tax=Scortum barcoo TaxID=214431 RepID=A0ACB8VLJ6_9TELE|nr:hypothetical protein L3Q82_017219 [Scortum barcoo]
MEDKRRRRRRRSEEEEEVNCKEGRLEEEEEEEGEEEVCEEGGKEELPADSEQRSPAQVSPPLRPTAMLPPRLSVALLAVSCALWPAAVRAASCESVRIPMCRSMPWNMTKMPNHLHHSTQDNAVLAIEQFEGLLANSVTFHTNTTNNYEKSSSDSVSIRLIHRDFSNRRQKVLGEKSRGTRCSPDLLFYLCAMYAPICTIDFQHEPIKPCKAVCERAKQGCEPVMKRYNHSWPESLACTELPQYDRGVCISPEAIVKAEGPDSYYQDPTRCNPESSPDFPMDSNNFHCRERIGDSCTCKPVKMGLKTYKKNNYNYVIRARVREVRNRGLEPTAVVEVKEVFKSSLVNIPKDTQTLYYSSSCLCPRLSPGEDYLIMGYENEETSRLLLIDTSIAQKWKDRMGKKVKKWDQSVRAGQTRTPTRQRSRH